VISVTAGGAAARAGIKVGDVIVDLAGQPTISVAALHVMLAALQAR
jgi:S1-C subfamily serine protease